MMFMFINLDVTIYMKSKYLNELFLKISKELKILKHYATIFLIYQRLRLLRRWSDVVYSIGAA